MAASSPCLNIAYLHFGEQSGVTQNVTRSLMERGHRIHSLQVPGPLDFRDERGHRRLTWQAALGLSISALHFGRQALDHRWNTEHAFDVHSRRAGKLLADLHADVDVILQNGALFAPGDPPALPYVLLLDHTRALSMAQPAMREEGLPAPLNYGPGWQARETSLYLNARCVATFSERVARSLRDDYGVPAERIRVVRAGAGIDCTPVDPDTRPPTAIFVGKDFKRKGGAILLHAFEQLRSRRRSARLMIVGPRETLALPEGAVHLGRQPADHLPALFAQASVFVLPTLREPFGIAFLDAMACGLPCIGTNVEAVPEIIVDGVTGRLVPPGDVDALTEAMKELLDDPAQARAMGLRGRARVAREFTWGRVAERLEAALLAEPPAVRTRARGYPQLRVV